MACHEPLILLLAAGHGRRFAVERPGADKLAVDLARDGRVQPLLLHSLDALLGQGSEVLLVCSPGREALAEQARQRGARVEYVHSQGLGESLAHGVSAGGPRAGGWLVALADMPWIRRDSIARVLQAMSPRHVCLPTYQARRGHPVGFPGAALEALSSLAGDQGARHVLQQWPVHELALDDPGILRDVDRPADLD